MGKEERWKEVLRAKYLLPERERSIDQILTNQKGTTLWKLLLKVAPIIIKFLFWIPGNGEKINLRIDLIMNNPPLENRHELLPLQKKIHGP